MYKVLKYIRQNRYKIAGIIIFIILVFSIINMANNEYDKKEKNISQKDQNEKTIETDGTIKLTDNNCQNVIDEFLKNCTKGNYDIAYSYLSEECKESKYSTLEDFRTNYCEQHSIKGKGYSIEKYSKYKYKALLNSMLESGKTKTNKEIVYFSITVDNGHDIKVNID